MASFSSFLVQPIPLKLSCMAHQPSFPPIKDGLVACLLPCATQGGHFNSRVLRGLCTACERTQAHPCFAPRLPSRSTCSLKVSLSTPPSSLPVTLRGALPRSLPFDPRAHREGPSGTPRSIRRMSTRSSSSVVSPISLVLLSSCRTSSSTRTSTRRPAPTTVLLSRLPSSSHW